MDLSGRVIVITGASRGLGKALCKRLSSLGATVVGCSLHGDPVQSVESVDVRNSKDVDDFVAEVISKHERIDVLINNAGWAGKLDMLENVTDAEYEQQVRTNIDGVFFFLRRVVGVMKKQNEGVIINVGSRAGWRPHPELAVYSATKAAVRALTRALVRELEEEESAVRCIVISPGGIDTDMREQLFGEENSRKQQSPDRVAELITQIITEEITVPNGADVGIVRGEIDSVTEMS